MPVTGMEAEFNVVLDGVEIDPRAYWKDPTAFIDVPMLRRTRSSLQRPTGGAVYFDRGVIEVVTPVIELAPHSTARMVRNLWEQIGFVRDQLTKALTHLRMGLRPGDHDPRQLQAAVQPLGNSRTSHAGRSRSRAATGARAPGLAARSRRTR